MCWPPFWEACSDLEAVAHNIALRWLLHHPSSLTCQCATTHQCATATSNACCRGWRRSGRWVYYPLHECSCCQLLTIRLDVTKFQPNKDQVRSCRFSVVFL